MNKDGTHDGADDCSFELTSDWFHGAIWISACGETAMSLSLSEEVRSDVAQHSWQDSIGLICPSV